jgi:hypothetical protein
MEMKYGFPKSNNRDEDLKITGYSIIARDITFLKNIEEKTDRRLKKNTALKSFTAKVILTTKALNLN